MPEQRSLFATVPVEVEFPDGMAADIASVLGGEYESGYSGSGLTIADIGANIGAFSIWASLRWPNSVIQAFEPQPQTFEILRRNTANLPNIVCHNAAVYPGRPSQRSFYSRYAGDGESGLVDYIDRTFADLPRDRVMQVKTVPPGDLPACDVLKLDVEGGEASILESMDVSSVSLILLEYQDMENRSRIERRLNGDFACVYEDTFPWRAILRGTEYRAELADDCYGHLFFVNRRNCRLRKSGDARQHAHARWPIAPGSLSLRQLLNVLPAAIRRAASSRLR